MEGGVVEEGEGKREEGREQRLGGGGVGVWE